MLPPVRYAAGGAGTVRELITGSGIELESRGRRTLKGEPDRRPVFAIAGLAG